MKIGLFTDGYLPQINGVATSVNIWARALQKRGHEVYIIAPAYPKVRDKVNVIRLNAFSIKSQPEIRLATFLPNRQLYRVARIDFDIIHGFSGGPITSLGLIIAKFKKVPFVFKYDTRWNLYTHYFLKGKLIKPRMMEKISQVFCDRCDLIIAPVAIIKEELVSYGIKKPVVIIKNGIEIENYADAKKGYLKKMLKLKKEDQILLYVGRLGKEKSVDFIIRAFKNIKLKLPNYKLVLVGDGSEKERLESLVNKLDLKKEVIFTGALEYNKVPKIYPDASLFLFASRTETQGMVLLESLAAGVPVVALSDPVIKEVVKDNYNGILIKGSIKEFADKAVRLLQNTNRLNEYSRNAKLSAKDFSSEQAALELENHYKKLIAKKRKQNLASPLLFNKTKKILLKYLQSPL
jgi:1,2-diacylglycerol 3-alpha-glucosyltransferase